MVFEGAEADSKVKVKIQEDDHKYDKLITIGVVLEGTEDDSEIKK